jgi:hypothetical protein
MLPPCLAADADAECALVPMISDAAAREWPVLQVAKTTLERSGGRRVGGGRRGGPGADVAGVSPVPARMWQMWLG